MLDRRRLLSLAFVAALAWATPATATPILYSLVLTTTASAHVGDGELVVDDSGFAPAAGVPLDAFDVEITAASPSYTTTLSDCSTAQGVVDGSGGALEAVSASCVSNGGGGPATLDLELDGTFAWILIPGIIEAFGTYELSEVGVLPEPGPVLLLAAAGAAGWFARRRRP